MLYDILKLESSDKNHPRGTGEDILVNMEHPIAKTILDYREVAKLLNTFVDKLPKMVNPVDGRIHASFNACGTVTGRLSSSNPNCISKGTLISCPGEEKKIEDIQVGDMVYCFDKLHHLIRIRSVKNIWYKGIQPCVKLKIKVDDVVSKYLICTEDHKILTFDRGMISATELILGEKIIINSKNKECGYVNSIDKIENFEVYDIEVEEFHNFFANDICVSNCQQIPSRGPGKEVRNMFRATISKDIDIKNSENSFVVNLYSRIPTDRGYLYLDELKVGDKLILEDSEKEVKVNVTKIEIETGSIYYDFE